MMELQREDAVMGCYVANVTETVLNGSEVAVFPGAKVMLNCLDCILTGCGEIRVADNEVVLTGSD